ncbi:MAG: GTP cyclohydrolase, FolE2/MptA family [Patescibacteria group bacterium]|nr:GTP cyclohydrolase, FolE2/MptA family [Patescibacteria group bacterium]
MPKQYKDPVNYSLTENDFASPNYDNFLDGLTDVPASIPLQPYSIDRAGIKEQFAYIKLRSLYETNEWVTVLANITMQVGLTGHRGIHMSRCEEALFSLLETEHDSLDMFAVALAEKILVLQDSESAFVNVEGTYIHKRSTIKSHKQSYDRMTMFAYAQAEKNHISKVQIGLAAFNMTGCPCTETFTKFAVVPQLKSAGFNLKEITKILDITNSGTHTQRGLATIRIDKTDEAVTYEKIYDVLSKSCHLVYELLKRPDEHELVVRVLKNPQFTEDVVRDIIHHTIKILGVNLRQETRIFASSQLYDSIHIHDVYTEIEKTYSELISEHE